MRRNYDPLGGLPRDRQDPGPGGIHYPGEGGASAHRPGPSAMARPPRPGAAGWSNPYTATNFPFVIGTESMQIVPANPLRTYLLIQNKDAGSDMFINFGQKANSFNGVIIVPRGNYEFVGGSQGGPFCPNDSVWVIGTAAVMQGVLVEGVKPL